MKEEEKKEGYFFIVFERKGGSVAKEEFKEEKDHNIRCFCYYCSRGGSEKEKEGQVMRIKR